MDKGYTDAYIGTHLGDDYHRFQGAVIPPLYQNSLFVFNNYADFVTALKNEQKHYLYWRGTNPTVEIVEQKIAAFEQGEACKCFASGMAAISATLLSCLKSGDHVLCISNIYGPTLSLLKYLQKFGIQHTTIYETDIHTIEASIQNNTKVIYLESPTTMTFRLVDLPAVSKLAKANNIKTIIDNTWATPIFQKPLLMGIDIVIHSVSKYLGGHSDLVGGALVTNKANMEEIFYHEYQLLGGVMPPYEAWLLMRGLRTLPVRMRAHEEAAMRIAQFLAEHPAVRKVNYPGLPTHPDYELGRQLLKGYSGLMSFELKADSYEAVENVINRLKLFNIGVSWGGFESLVSSPNLGYNTKALIEQRISPGTIRISIGLEDVDSLIEDLDFALSSK